jgi:hypothetical protein
MKVALAVVGILCMLHGACAQYLCTYTSNINITAADMVPAKFVVSSYDCCQLCSDTAGCAAAVYSNYYCHLKGTTKPQVTSIGPTLISQVGPSPTQQPQAPSLVPAPTPPPATSPPPAASVTLVREVSCQYSDSCDRRSDYSCVTNVYTEGACVHAAERLCGASTIQVARFDSQSCVPPVKSTTKEPLNTCSQTEDETYVGHYCDTWPSPTVNMTMERTVCPYGCNDGTECTKHTWLTGSCVANPISSLPGESLMVWCFPAYVVFATYGGLSCMGTPAAAIAEPIGTKCFLDNNQAHHQNLCG